MANLEISAFDPFIKKMLEILSPTYFYLIPDSDSRRKENNTMFVVLNIQLYVACSSNLQPENKHLIDIVTLYETMQQILAPNQLVMKNVSINVNLHGVLFGNLSNHLSIARRIVMILGKKPCRPREELVSSVFEEHIHIREYAKYEVRCVPSNNFIHIKIYGFSPYNNYLKHFTILLTSKFRSIFFLKLKRPLIKGDALYEI